MVLLTNTQLYLIVGPLFQKLLECIPMQAVKSFLNRYKEGLQAHMLLPALLKYNREKAKEG